MLNYYLEKCKKGLRKGEMSVYVAHGSGKSVFHKGRSSNGKIGDSKSFDVGSIPTRPAN